MYTQTCFMLSYYKKILRPSWLLRSLETKQGLGIQTVCHVKQPSWSLLNPKHMLGCFSLAFSTAFRTKRILAWESSYIKCWIMNCSHLLCSLILFSGPSLEIISLCLESYIVLVCFKNWEHSKCGLMTDIIKNMTNHKLHVVQHA